MELTLHRRRINPGIRLCKACRWLSGSPFADSGDSGLLEGASQILRQPPLLWSFLPWVYERGTRNCVELCNRLAYIYWTNQSFFNMSVKPKLNNNSEMLHRFGFWRRHVRSFSGRSAIHIINWIPQLSRLKGGQATFYQPVPLVWSLCFGRLFKSD